MTVDRPVEIELKYRVRDRATGERLLAADVLGPFRATSGARTAQHEDRYIDTSDGALARAGYAARLRLTNGGTIVTVKSTTPAEGALARREELEGPADRTAEPRDWPASAARSLMLELCGDVPLVELVTVRQLRRKRRLKGDDAAAELSLDEVDVVSRGRVIDRFVELEVELTYGNDARLEELASFLRADPGLTPATGSKLDAALAASAEDDEAGPSSDGDRGPAPVPVMSPIEEPDPAETDGSVRDAAADARKAARKLEKRAARAAVEAAAIEAGRAAAEARADGPLDAADAAATADAPAGSASAAAAIPGVAAPEPLVVGKNAGVVGEDTVAEAGRKVLRFHLARMLAREAGTRNGSDPEELHSMRVATRRMRAAWRVFGDGFRPGRTRRHRRELREIAGRLGAVRDLDVLIEAGEAYLGLQAHHEQLALQPLFTAWRAQREDARVLLIRELDSDGYGRWVDEFREFVRTDGLGAVAVLPTSPHRIRDTAASRIWTRLRTGPCVRTGPSLVRRGDPPRAQDRRQVAPLLARVRPRVPRSRGRRPHRAGHRPPGPSWPPPRCRRGRLDDEGVPRRAGRPSVRDGDRGDRTLPGRSGARGQPPPPVDRRPVARRRRADLPARAREGRQRPLSPPPRISPAGRG